MNDRNDKQAGCVVNAPEIQPKKGRWHIKVRTFLVPLFFMILHLAVLNMMVFARVFFHIASISPAEAEALRQRLLDSADSIGFMIEIGAQTYASFFAMFVLIPVYLFYICLRRKKGIQMLGWSSLPLKKVFASCAIVLGAMGLTQIWMVFLSQLDQSSALGLQFQKYLKLMEVFEPSSGWMFVLEVITTVFLIPVGEELLFRGIIQDEFRRAFPAAVAIPATALLFAVFHGNFVQGSYVFAVGLTLSLAYYLTDHILVPIGMHVVYNFIGSGIFSHVAGFSDRGETVMMYVLYAAIPFMAAGIIFLFRWRAKSLASEEPAGSRL